MAGKICYLGDGSLSGAASYLAGILLHEGLAFDYVSSGESPPASFSSSDYALYIISDYPAARFGATAMTHVAARVQRGAGLLMLGGWESFFGQLGEYHASPLADVLPVVMQQADDRRNCWQPCLIRKMADHPILEGLPWDRPPGIGGFNAIAPKPNSQTLLNSVQFSAHRTGGGFQFNAGAESPLLVVGRYGHGRTAALATDVAPHWVGGLVDWGDRRVVQKVESGEIEVGSWYVRFFANLIRWTGGMEFA